MDDDNYKNDPPERILENKFTNWWIASAGAPQHANLILPEGTSFNNVWGMFADSKKSQRPVL